MVQMALTRSLGTAVLANLCTLLLVGLGWWNLQLLLPHCVPIGWALLCSLALFPAKSACISAVRRAAASTLGPWDFLVAAADVPFDNVRFVFDAWRRVASPLAAPVLARLFQSRPRLARAVAVLLHVRLPGASLVDTPNAAAAGSAPAPNAGDEPGASPASTLTAGTSHSGASALAAPPPRRPAWLSPPKTTAGLFWAALWAGYTALVVARAWAWLLVIAGGYVASVQAFALARHFCGRRRVRRAISQFWDQTALVPTLQCVGTSVAFAVRAIAGGAAVCARACQWLATAVVAGIGLDALIAVVLIVGAVCLGIASAALLGVQLTHEWTTEVSVVRSGIGAFWTAESPGSLPWWGPVSGFLEANNLTSPADALALLSSQGGALDAGVSWVCDSWPNETALLRQLWVALKESNGSAAFPLEEPNSTLPAVSGSTFTLGVANVTTIVVDASGETTTPTRTASPFCEPFQFYGEMWSLAQLRAILAFARQQPFRPTCWWEVLDGATGLGSLPLLRGGWVSGALGWLDSALAPALTSSDSASAPRPVAIPGLDRLLPSLESVGGLLGTVAESSGAAVVAARRVLIFCTTYALSLSSSVVDFALSLLLFINLLYYLLAASQNWLRRVLEAVLPPEACEHALTELSSAIQQVLLVNIKAAVFHGLFTYLALSFAGTHLVATFSTLAAVGAVLPFFPSTLVVAPAALELAISGAPVAAMLLLVVHNQALSYFMWYQYEEHIRYAHPALLGLSIIAGLGAFGARGVILGPLLVSLLVCCSTLLSGIMRGSLERRHGTPPASALAPREATSRSAGAASSASGSRPLREATSASALRNLATPSPAHVWWSPRRGVRRRVLHTRSAIPLKFDFSGRRNGGGLAFSAGAPASNSPRHNIGDTEAALTTSAASRRRPAATPLHRDSWMRAVPFTEASGLALH